MSEKKYTKRELEEYVTKLMSDSATTSSKQQEKIEELKKENQRLSAELTALKRKDKASARALTLSERKNKYIQDVTKSRCAIEIDRLTRLSARYAPLFDRLDAQDRADLEAFNKELSATISTLENLGEYIEDRKPLSDAEKNYIQEKKRISLNDALKSDLDTRFDKLKQEFNQKVGASASRGRGRPRKSDQSILVEVNRVAEDCRKEEISEAEKQEVIQKLNDLFYGTKPAQPAITTDAKQNKKPKNKAKSVDAFDYDEALNPSLSLADIMKDL
jgi:hypothetical protein